MMWRIACLVAWSLAVPAHAGTTTATPADRIGPADLARIAELSEPEFSPDGRYVAYVVTTTNLEADKQQSDLWRVLHDGGGRVQLTHTPDKDEWRPSWSPDGGSLAFLSDRGEEDAKTQVWVMPAQGGEARRLTDFPGGVTDYAWSPDGTRLAVIASDPERPPGAVQPKNPPPIVTERYWFKEDGTGYLDARRQHLYVFDLATGTSELLTPGAHDERMPAWSPDGRYIAYVTKRGADPDRHMNFDIYLVEPHAGAEERRLTEFVGGDNDPDWGSRLAWSPDGKRIAHLQGGEDKWIYYSPAHLAVTEVATGATRRPAPVDRWFGKPRWSKDGRSLYVLIEHSRVTHLSRVSLADGRITALTSGPRTDADFAVAGDRVVVLGGGDDRPAELAALGPKGLRALTAHNEWLAAKRLAAVEDISFKSADGTPVDGFLVKPLDYVPGRRYPTILRIHGGPVYQFSHEFMVDWQAYAASGYAVVAANPRGSSGRGFDFARAIYADWGNKDVADVLAAVDHVVALGIADPARLGVGGRSYGGILTNYVIASDQRFKAAVSGAGVSNLLGFYGHDMYTREYDHELGFPWRDRGPWDRVSYPFLHADRITTPTLFYCAEADFNVPCLGTEQMYQALRSQDVPTRLVVYPGENHTLKVPSYLRDRLERLVGWYDRYLKP